MQSQLEKSPWIDGCIRVDGGGTATNDKHPTVLRGQSHVPQAACVGLGSDVQAATVRSGEVNDKSVAYHFSLVVHAAEDEQAVGVHMRQTAPRSLAVEEEGRHVRTTSA